MEEPERFLSEELGKRLTLKEKSIVSPEQCLRKKVSQVTLENGVKCWSFSSSQCFQDAAKNAEYYRLRVNIGPLLNANSPWTSNYRPEADVTSELTSTKESYYKSLVVVLW